MVMRWNVAWGIPDKLFYLVGEARGPAQRCIGVLVSWCIGARYHSIIHSNPYQYGHATCHHLLLLLHASVWESTLNVSHALISVQVLLLAPLDFATHLPDFLTSTPYSSPN